MRAERALHAQFPPNRAKWHESLLQGPTCDLQGQTRRKFGNQSFASYRYTRLTLGEISY